MSDTDPPKDELKEGKEEKKETTEDKKEKAEEKKETEENIEEKKEEKEEDKKEDEEEKSEEEKEKPESSSNSDSEIDESKNSKESKESKESNEEKKSKDKKEKDEEENEEDDDDDDDLDDDVDDEGNSDESSSDNKQKDPHHGYMNSKTEYKNFFNSINKNNYVYGFKQNKFYKILNIKNIANDKRSQIYKFELKEIKNSGEGGKKINMKLAKNIQYMASIYGKAQEEEKEKDIKKKEKNENKNKEKEEKNLENDKKKENLNEPEEKKENNIEKENKSDEKHKNGEKKENTEEENKKENNEDNKNKKEENKEIENKEKENKEENKDKDKDKPKDKKEKDSKKKNNKKKVKNLNPTAVIKDLTEYTFFQKIRVIFLNSLNNPVVFYQKINMNTSIKEIIEQFSDLYHYKHDRYSDKIPLHIFINGKKHSISNRTESKYFIPTKFDYKNDYILILEKQSFKLKELDIGSRRNYLNLKGADVVHAVYNSIYNYEVDSFLITKGITSLDCQVYELKKELNIRQFTDNEHTIKQKLREFLELNWKEKTNFVTSFKSIKVKNSKSYNCNLFEINRKFILLEGKIYVFVIKSNNKKLDVFNGKRIHTEGVYIVSKNNKSILDGFRAKAISDFTANS